MGENLHDIDKLFRDSIEGHTDMPSAKVWDAIDHKLDKRHVTIVRRKYKKLEWLSAALVLLLLGTIAYEVVSKKQEAGNKDVNKINSSQKVNNEIPGEAENNKNISVSKAETATKSSGSENTNGMDTLNSMQPEKIVSDGEINKTSPLQTIQPLTEIKKAHDFTEKKYTNRNDETGEWEQGLKSRLPGSTGNSLAIRNNPARQRTIKFNNEQTDINKNIEKEQTAAPASFTGNLFKKVTIEETANANPGTPINAVRSSPDAMLQNNYVNNRITGTIKPFRFKLMAFFSPQFGFNRLETDHDHDRGSQHDADRDDIEKTERDPVSYSLGILTEIPLRKNWSLQSGITYTRTKIDIEPRKLFARLDNTGSVKYRFDCSSGYTYLSPKSGIPTVAGDSINAIESGYRLQYIGIPIRLSYRFSVGKISVNPLLGVTTNFAVGKKLQANLQYGSSSQKQTTSSIEGLRSIYFNAVTGVGLDYRLTKKTSLSIAPTASFALSSITQNAAVKSYPNSFGITTGIKIDF